MLWLTLRRRSSTFRPGDSMARPGDMSQLRHQSEATEVIEVTYTSQLAGRQVTHMYVQCVGHRYPRSNFRSCTIHMIELKLKSHTDIRVYY